MSAPKMTDADLMAINPEQVKRVANRLNHKDYMLYKYQCIKSALDSMMVGYNMGDIEDLGLVDLLKYRRKALNWIEAQLKEY